MGLLKKKEIQIKNHKRKMPCKICGFRSMIINSIKPVGTIYNIHVINEKKMVSHF